MGHSAELTPVPAPTSAVPAARDLRTPLVGVGAAALLAAVGFAGGGYFPGSWGWIALVCAWVAGIALVLETADALGRRELALLGAAVALALWILLSATWSSDVTQTGLEAQRMLAYATWLLAALLLGRRAPRALLAGTWGAISILSVWSVLTRVAPERFATPDPTAKYRLSEPIGYWNSLGLLAVIGVLLALGLVARSHRPLERAAAGASLVPLAATLFFTFSRGAWIALAVGLVVAIAADTRRLQLLGGALLAAAAPAIGILLSTHAHAMTTAGSPLPRMTSEGHRLGLELLGLTLLGAALAAATLPLERRLRPGRTARRAAAAALVAAVVAGAAGVFAAYGSPVTIARHGWRSFSAPPSAQLLGPNLNERLFQLSSNGRIDEWKVAWRDAGAHPLLGSGAGSFERYWNAHRPLQLTVRDAHSLYVETLAELGPLGLALLLGVLLVPLLAAGRARRHPLGALALAAYAAYLVHAGVDWDWEIAAVTLAALTVGVALLGLGAGEAAAAGQRTRRTLLGAAVLAAALGVWVLGTRIPLDRLSSAAAHGNWSAAQRDASRASTLAPWSSEPWRRLAEADLAARRFAAARVAADRALAVDSGDWRLWLDLAQASNGKERAGALDRALLLNPRSPEALDFRKTLVSLSAIDQGTK